MIYFNIAIFVLSLIGTHFSKRINNWGRILISLAPILILLVSFIAKLNIDYLSIAFPFIASYLIIGEKKRSVAEVLPYGILLLPLDINIKIIAFAACVYLNFGDFRNQSFSILKLAIISFITLVDKTGAFKYLFSVYLLLSFLDSDNDDFAITDGVILSFLLSSNIQHISQNLNQFLIGLVFIIFLSLLNKKNVFKFIFVLSAIICVLINLESQLMGLVIFYYMIRSFQTSVYLIAKEVKVFEDYINITALSHLGIIGLLTLSFSTLNPFFITLASISTLLVFVLGSEELVKYEMSEKWYESFYSLLFYTIFGSSLFLLASNEFSINRDYLIHASLTYFFVGTAFIIASFKFRKFIGPFSVQIHLSNLKRLIYMNNWFYNASSSRNDKLALKRIDTVNNISISYKAVRTISLVVTALYFLALIIQVAK